MSSSGLIYAGIVGAWAVYLVPVWLRREEQLNEAREKARYAAAIRTLGRSQRFEKKVLAEETLAATGTDGAPGPRAGDGRDTATPDKPAPRKTAVLPTPASVESVKSVENAKQKPALKPRQSPAAAAQPRKGVTARLPQHQPTAKPAPGTSGAKPSPAATAARRRGVLLMRRRRVVAALFTLATLGAVVSTFAGLEYIWAMLAPAALFSGYVVYIRRDEKQRARERFRRRQAALVAERRRERQRQAEQRVAATSAPAAPVDAVVREPESTVWRPAQPPQEYRRAANG